MTADVVRARRLVEARLGRAPQDAIEAAVVLEAWAGVPAQRALETARALMPRPGAAPQASAASPRIVARPRGVAFEALAFLVTVVAIALWAEPLADAFGAPAVTRALRVALPLTLACQWALLCRHLGRPSGLAGLAPRVWWLVGAAPALVGALTLLAGVAGTLAGLLTVTWAGGGVLIRRGWAWLYCAPIACAVAPLLGGVAPLTVVAAVAGVVVVLAAAALVTEVEAAPVTPGRWSRTLGAGATGAGVGILLVGDPTVSWVGGAGPALALLPSTAGALWAGQHLWRLAGAFPRALAGVPACAAPAPQGGRAAPPGGDVAGRHAARGVPAGPTGRSPGADGAAPTGAADASHRRGADPRGATGDGLRHEAGAAPMLPGGLPALLGAVARLVGVTATGSAALLALGLGPGRAGVLAGFGVVALATLLLGLLESLGQPSVAAAGVAAGVAAELLVRVAEPPFAGAALLAGGAVAAGVMLPAALVLLARPARTLATTLWIT